MSNIEIVNLIGNGQVDSDRKEYEEEVTDSIHLGKIEG